VVAATYVAKAGEVEAVRIALEAMIPHAFAEPGCIDYRPHASVEDPNTFLLYEEYVDEDGYRAHAESPHFEQYIRGDVWPRLESRTVIRAQPLE
jgi:quinol monooxygenase YgiN